MKLDFRAGLKNVGLLLVSVLIAGVFAEIGMGLAGVELDGSLYTGDRERGWSWRPNAKGWNVKEGRQYVEINSDGLRDREHTLEKPADTLRIALLGDSFSAAVEIPMEKAFWVALERDLAACPGVAPKKVEVINFGVGGYGAAQELVTLRNNAWKYSPDIVLLQFFVGNDLFNATRTLNDRYAHLQINAPYLVYQGDQLVLDQWYQSLPDFEPSSIALTNSANEVLNRSRVLLMLAKARRDIVRPRGELLGDPKDLQTGPLERQLFKPPKNAEFEEAWRVTEGSLALMAEEVRAKGAELWMVTLSHPAQVFPDKAAREAFREKLGVEDLYYPDRRLRDFAEKQGIHVAMLAPEMAAYADAHPDEWLHGFPNSYMGQGHWNELGHRVGGELLTKKMCEALSAAAAAKQAPPQP